MMGRGVSTCIFSVTLFLGFLMVSSQEAEVKRSLVKFMANLNPGNLATSPDFGWNMTSLPCKDNWRGVTCDASLRVVRKIVLDGLNLTGVLDAAALCSGVTSISVLSLNGNSLSGGIQSEISNCQSLTHLFLGGNNFSGVLPSSLPQLGNLKRLVISNNNLSGPLPDLSRISGLLTFLAQNNQLTGRIPDFHFFNLENFNVSNNNFSGPIPGNVPGNFDSDSFLGNPLLCGEPLPNVCPPPPPPPPLSPPPPPPPPPPAAASDKKSKRPSKTDYLIYFGYGALGLALVIIVLAAYMIFKRKKAAEEEYTGGKTIDKTTRNSGVLKTVGRYVSEYSMTAGQIGRSYSSLVVLSSPAVDKLKFEDLLKAPAEFVGRGKYGSLFKVMLDDGMTLAVKRIRNVGIPRDDFKKQMKRIDRVKHPNVLPVVAYYCSETEKLLVYEFQYNGSLFNLLHESHDGEVLDWASRLGMAASIAQALAFMHEQLRSAGIAHGNLKSTNILFNEDMEPCISEYGLMVVENDEDLSVEFSFDGIRSATTTTRGYSAFKVDVYAFGVILLELLTGKIVQNGGGEDLGRWVHSVVREEWSVEVFDKALLSAGANEERMVQLLQVAMKCMNPSPEARPSIGQIATMISSLKEAEERSLGSEESV